jgi:uncharacterized protein YhfF
MADDPNEHESVKGFWDAYVASARVGHAEFVVLRFGDGAELADELAAQVVAGTKRGMTSLLRDVTESGEPMLRPGVFCVVVDGKNAPRCIVQILHVEIRPLRDVDEDFAWDDGGGDRSLEWWRSAHLRYFKRQGDREGFAVDDLTLVVLGRFAVVWPYELAKLRFASDWHPAGASPWRRASSRLKWN